MNRKISSLIYVSLLVIGGFVGIFIVTPNEIEAPGPTEISGLISDDTTWTADDSPYIIIDNTTLMSNKTLTIEAGSEIKFKDNTWLKIRGILDVKGNSNNRVVFTNEDTLKNYTRSFSSWEGNPYNYSGSGINYHLYITGKYAQINITHAQFEYSTHDYGALYLSLSDEIEHSITNTIFNNNYRGLNAGPDNLIIKECTFRDNFNGIANGYGIAYDSIFNNNTVGIHGAERLIINNCRFINNKIGLVGGINDLENSILSENDIGCLGTSPNFKLKYNSIYNNNVGVILPHSSHPSYPFNVQFNDILNNGFNLKLQGPKDRNVSNNWWGTTNTSIIDQYIYDIYDDVSLGEVFYEPFLLTKFSELLDTDIDGIPDIEDEDDDNDGYLDEEDEFPLDPIEWTDSDDDGIGNNTDPDDDNDGYLDEEDAFPLDPNEMLDTDKDGIGNNADSDDDNDGYLDGNDTFPLNTTEWEDTDSDGTGDNVDPDDDNDGYADEEDAFPLDPLRWEISPDDNIDTDNDGTPDIEDNDDDNDGHLDDVDDYPLDETRWSESVQDSFNVWRLVAAIEAVIIGIILILLIIVILDRGRKNK